MRTGRRILASLSLLLAANAVWAVDYRSVGVPAAILYDAPSQKGKKLYLIKAQTPVEVLVRLDGWVKVRDAEGSLAWIESHELADRRTVIVTASKAEIRQAESTDAPVLLELDKWVALDFVEPASAGWAKVRHRDGVVGFIRSMQVFGL